MDSLACVGCDRGQKASVRVRKPFWKMSGNSGCPCGQVGLSKRLSKLNMLSCVGYVGGKKTSV